MGVVKCSCSQVFMMVDKDSGGRTSFFQFQNVGVHEFSFIVVLSRHDCPSNNSEGSLGVFEKLDSF